MSQLLSERFRQIKPIDDMEVALVRGLAANPGWFSPAEQAVVRYSLNLARVTVFRNLAGKDIDLTGELEPYRRRVTGMLGPFLSERLGKVEPYELHQFIAPLKALTHETRARLLGNHGAHFSKDDLDHEVCQKSLVLVLGGGGGAGYVYLGVLRALETMNVTPSLVVGTSMGSIIGLFRARWHHFDHLRIREVMSKLTWRKVFRIISMSSKYGIPAAMRLYLRSAISEYFTHPDGRVLRMNELEIPYEVVVAGVRTEQLGHNLDYYEHMLDDIIAGGGEVRVSGIRRAMLKNMGALLEIFAKPSVLREIPIGHDESTRDFDVLDAAGFSSAVPGVIHYDVLRDDQHMHRKLGELLEHFQVSRLMDGGLVNNVPARVAWESVQRGRTSTRNIFILACDCLAPNPLRFPLWLPITRIAHENVKRNAPFAHLLKTFPKTLSPMDLVPPADQAEKAAGWGQEALEPDLPFVRKMLEFIPGLSREYEDEPPVWRRNIRLHV